MSLRNWKHDFLNLQNEMYALTAEVRGLRELRKEALLYIRAHQGYINDQMPRLRHANYCPTLIPTTCDGVPAHCVCGHDRLKALLTGEPGPGGENET